ncbi:MAG: acylphosphatase [Thermoplasmata archaeon]|nr:acylphosphatase [Thermoplasmata archaeon]
MKRTQVIFHGKVQGVFFRANCKTRADALEVRGWVKNLPDSSVESVMEGNENSVKELIEWCCKKQPIARVTSIDINWEPVTGEFHVFHIMY